jgi:hypothetical protein
MTKTHTTTRVLLAAAAACLGLLVVGVGGAAAAPAASQVPTNACWKAVINDWLQNHPYLKGTYAIPCYTQAIQHLDAYPDIQGYSSAPDDIRNALLAAIHDEGRGGGGSAGGAGGAATPTDGGSSGGETGTTDTSPTHPSLFTRLFDAVTPGNAQSVPLPLIVLGGLALLLLLAAAATWFARRMQTRRVTPAPAPAPARTPRP